MVDKILNQDNTDTRQVAKDGLVKEVSDEMISDGNVANFNSTWS